MRSSLGGWRALNERRNRLLDEREANGRAGDLRGVVDADRLLQADGKERRGINPFFPHGLIEMIFAYGRPPRGGSDKFHLDNRRAPPLLLTSLLPPRS